MRRPSRRASWASRTTSATAWPRGRRVFDFLRGDEGYKYRWGAVDEPIYRLIVTRRADG